jgi:hypothetical protein
MPEPTTIATNRAVPRNSANTFFISAEYLPKVNAL